MTNFIVWQFKFSHYRSTIINFNIKEIIIFLKEKVLFLCYDQCVAYFSIVDVITFRNLTQCIPNLSVFSLHTTISDTNNNSPSTIDWYRHPTSDDSKLYCHDHDLLCVYLINFGFTIVIN